MADALVTVGCVLILLAALTLAIAMNIQQFALSGDLNSNVFKRVRCCSGADGSWNSARNVMWVFGLGIYLFAQLLVVASLALAPFALVSALFGMVLVFDNLIAAIFLHKRFNNLELAGMGVIVASLAVCAPNSPNVEYDITPDFMEGLFKKPPAIVVVSVLACFAFCGWLAVRSFERVYRAKDVTLDPGETEQAPVFVPDKVFRRMQIIYPTILAIVETMGSASLKAIGGMVQVPGSSQTAVFWCIICVWIFAIVSTVLWLRFVYQQFRTCECLPTEIGLTTVFSIYVGLWVYQEQKYASTRMLSIMIVCTFMILGGISLIVVGGGRRKGNADGEQEQGTQKETTDDMETVEVGTSGIAADDILAAAATPRSRPCERFLSGRFPFVPISPARLRPASEKKKSRRASLSAWAGQVVERVRRGSSLSKYREDVPQLELEDNHKIKKSLTREDLLVASPVSAKDVEQRLAARDVEHITVEIVSSAEGTPKTSPTSSRNSGHIVLMDLVTRFFAGLK